MSFQEIPATYEFMGLESEPSVPAEQRFIFQGLVWPPPETLKKKTLTSGELDPEILRDTMDWIKQVLKPQWTAPDLEKRMVAARAIVSDQDALVARYVIDGSKIQIVVTKYNMHITVEGPTTAAAAGQALPQYGEAAVHEYLQMDQPGGPWTTATIRGFLFGYQRRNPRLGWRDSISYLTDGRAVKLSLEKLPTQEPGGGPPKAGFQPSAEDAKHWFNGQ